MDILLKSGVCGNSMEEVRETVYFRVVRNFLKYRWLLSGYMVNLRLRKKP